MLNGRVTSGRTRHMQLIAIAAFVPMASSLLTTRVFAQSGSKTGQSAAENTRAAHVRSLNNSLLQLHSQMQQGATGSADAIRSEAARVIAERAAALQSLIEENPRTALTFAFSPELLSDLASKFHRSAGLLESHISSRGPVEVLVSDDATLKHSETTVWMKVGSQKLELFFAAGTPPRLQSGQVLNVNGVVLNGKLAVESSTLESGTFRANAVSPTSAMWPRRFLSPVGFLRGSPWPASFLWLWVVLLAALGIPGNRRELRKCVGRVATCAIALAFFLFSGGISFAQSSTCRTTGIQNVAVLLVTFPGYANPLNSSDVYNTFFGTSGRSLDGYWTEASYGQASATGNVFGVYTLTGSYSCSAISQMLNDGVAAADSAGVNLSSYNRIFVIFPDIWGCGWAGLSSVGCTSITSPLGSFTASTTFLPTRYMSPGDQAVELVTHEAGHQLGLMHSRSRDFSPDVLGTLGLTGTLSEYGDSFSTMGWWNLGHYAAPHKAELLNWLTAGTTYQVVQNSGTYTLQPFEQSPAGLEALKIQRGTGNDAWLWVEYRQPIGNYDLTLPTQPFAGALIHYEDSVTGLHTDLLNFNPGDSTWVNTALAAGQKWTDPYSNVSITASSATSTGLTVSVNYGATPCTSSAPGVNVSPLDPSIYPGQTASYSVSVTNNDSPACTSSTITLGSSEPAGWTTSLSWSSVTLSPGQSASVTMGKAAPSGTAAGTYAVNLNASNASGSISDTANATVMTPPTLGVSASAPGSSFVPPASVGITASVTNGGTPAAGASVTFTLTAPNGSTSKQTATTNSSGTATWSYRLSSKSLVGTYSVTAQAALSSGSVGKKTSTSPSTQTATSNAVTFSVQ